MKRKKKTNVNKAIRNENTTTRTHVQDLQARRIPWKGISHINTNHLKLELLLCRIASEHMVHTIILQKYRNDVALFQHCADRKQKTKWEHVGRFVTYKYTQFWLVESSTINPKLYSWFWQLIPNCTRDFDSPQIALALRLVPLSLSLTK